MATLWATLEKWATFNSSLWSHCAYLEVVDGDDAVAGLIHLSKGLHDDPLAIVGHRRLKTKFKYLTNFVRFKSRNAMTRK